MARRGESALASSEVQKIDPFDQKKGEFLHALDLIERTAGGANSLPVDKMRDLYQRKVVEARQIFGEFAESEDPRALAVWERINDIEMKHPEFVRQDQAVSEKESGVQKKSVNIDSVQAMPKDLAVHQQADSQDGREEKPAAADTVHFDSAGDEPLEGKKFAADSASRSEESIEFFQAPNGLENMPTSIKRHAADTPALAASTGEISFADETFQPRYTSEKNKNPIGRLDGGDMPQAAEGVLAKLQARSGAFRDLYGEDITAERVSQMTPDQMSALLQLPADARLRIEEIAEAGEDSSTPEEKGARQDFEKLFAARPAPHFDLHTLGQRMEEAAQRARQTVTDFIAPHKSMPRNVKFDSAGDEPMASEDHGRKAEREEENIHFEEPRIQDEAVFDSAGDEPMEEKKDGSKKQPRVEEEIFFDSQAQENESLYEKVDEIAANRLDQPKIVRSKNGRIAYGTDEGIGYKSRNEDAQVVNTEAGAFASIDGMGGYSKGDRAARIMAEELQKGIRNNVSFEDMQKAAFERMRDEVGGENGACYVACRVGENQLEIAQAGDVRLLIIGSDGKVRYQTQDEGNDLGVWNAVAADSAGITTKDVQKLFFGDRILLASDGLWKNFTSEETAQMIEGKPIEQAIAIINDAVKAKMKKATDAGDRSLGKPDNINVMIYDYSPAGREKSYDAPKSAEAAATPEESEQEGMVRREALEKDIGAARRKYLSAQKRVEDLSSAWNIVRDKFGGEVESSKAQGDLDEAEKIYRELRAEYMGDKADLYVLEQEKVMREKIELHVSAKSGKAKALAAGYGWYKNLARYNIDFTLGKLGVAEDSSARKYLKEKRLGQFLNRAVNIRTATSGLLLAGSVYLGPTTAGILTFAGRRAASGIGSGVGSYDLLNAGVDYWERRGVSRKLDDYVKNGKRLDIGDMEEALAYLKSKGLWAGKNTDQIEADHLYQDLSNRRNIALQVNIERIRRDEGSVAAASALQELSDKAMGRLMRHSKDERKAQAIYKGFSTVVGTVVGTGTLGEMLFGKKAQEAKEILQKPAAIPAAVHQEAAAAIPAKPISGDLVHDGRPTGGRFEVRGGAISIEPGNRGIEGAILDMKQTQPDQYAKLKGWLEENYSSKSASGNTDDKLIHRFILGYAQEKGIDPEKLNSISGGQINFDPQSGISIGSLQINEAAPASVTSHLSSAAEMPSIKNLPDVAATGRTGFIAEAAAAHQTGGNTGQTAADVSHARGWRTMPLEDTKASAPARTGAGSETAGGWRRIEQAPEAPVEAGRPGWRKVETAAETAGAKSKSAYEFIKFMIGEARSENFLRSQLQITPSRVDELQNQTIAEFLSADHADIARLDLAEVPQADRGLVKTLVAHIQAKHWQPSYIQSTTMRQAITSLAREYNNEIIFKSLKQAA